MGSPGFHCHFDAKWVSHAGQQTHARSAQQTLTGSRVTSATLGQRSIRQCYLGHWRTGRGLGKIAIDTHYTVRTLAAYLDEHPFPGMVEHVPAFTTVTIFYNPLLLTYTEVERNVRYIVEQMEGVTKHAGRRVKIPVCYGGKFGPDLTEMAKHNGITAEEVISVHTSGEYLVYMVGLRGSRTSVGCQSGLLHQGGLHRGF